MFVLSCNLFVVPFYFLFISNYILVTILGCILGLVSLLLRNEMFHVNITPLRFFKQKCKRKGYLTDAADACCKVHRQRLQVYAIFDAVPNAVWPGAEDTVVLNNNHNS